MTKGDSESEQAPGQHVMLRPIYFLVGCLMLVLGIIGAFLPLMPTTIFLILAAWFFGRSSPRLERWLLAHRQFGPTLRNWREHGAIARRAKIMACCGMSLGAVLFLVGARPGPLLAIGVLAAIGACAWYVVSRPEPQA